MSEANQQRIPPLVVIANPEENRVAFLRQALSRFGLPPAIVIAYPDIIASPTSVFERVPDNALVRIDSPGREFTEYRDLLRAGIPAREQEGGAILSAREITSLVEEKGRILAPRQWYLGFCAVLKLLRNILAAKPTVRFTTDIGTIATVFCKQRCHQRLAEAGIAVPPALPPVDNFEALLAAMEQYRTPRVFVKLRHGSAASGVVALAISAGRFVAYSTVEMAQDSGELRLFNTRSLQRYTQLAQIRTLINALGSLGVHVERWIPKASIEESACDLRMVVIAGEPAHNVLRLSHTPITNLHLGNRREASSLLRQRMTTDAWEHLRDTARQVAAVYDLPWQISMDIAVTPDFSRHYVLEVNAFGDLLKDITYQGLTTYEWEVQALRAGWMPTTHEPCIIF